MDDPDQGGLLSNEQLREYAPQIVEWGERPIEEGAVGVEIDRDADKDNVTLLFDAMKNTHVKKLTLKADMRETRMMPFNFTRSNEYDELKPKRAIVSGKPPINFWSWDAMILDVGAILSNTMPEEMYRFNEYMRKKIEAEILAKFVRPREPSRKKRREGSYARKRGIKATDKKPLMAQSIASFGGLFWGTKHGYHREWQPPQKGRRFGKTGTMNIIWVKQERWSKYMDYFTWDFELYYRTYVTVMALVEQNAEQGNELNFDMVTGEFEIQNYLLGTVPNVNYIPLTWAGAFMGKDKSFKKGFNPYVDYLNGGIGFSNSAVGDFLTAAQKRGTVQEQERYYSVDTGLCPEHNDTLEYKGGQLWCPDGQHFPERVLRREKTPGLGYQLQQRREREPEAFIDRMYMMAPRSTGACPDVWLAFMALALDEESRSKDIRGTTIIIASMEYLEGITGGFHYLKQIDEWSDILLIDVGDQDYSLIFKWEPDMMRDVKWICNKPGCNYTQPYSPNDWADTGSQYPPVHHGVNMKPSGIPIVNYVYVGTDVDNLPYYVLRAVTGGMGGQQFEF